LFSRHAKKNPRTAVQAVFKNTDLEKIYRKSNLMQRIRNGGSIYRLETREVRKPVAEGKRQEGEKELITTNNG
jgi:hypothetical protein